MSVFYKAFYFDAQLTIKTTQFHNLHDFVAVLIVNHCKNVDVKLQLKLFGHSKWFQLSNSSKTGSSISADVIEK